MSKSKNYNLEPLLRKIKSQIEPKTVDYPQPTLIWKDEVRVKGDNCGISSNVKYKEGILISIELEDQSINRWRIRFFNNLIEIQRDYEVAEINYIKRLAENQLRSVLKNIERLLE